MDKPTFMYNKYTFIYTIVIEKFKSMVHHILCMYELEIMERFSKMPVFSLSDINQVISNRAYAKKFLQAQIEKGRIFRIRRNAYTTYKDHFIGSAFIISPSYVSSVSALSYHKLITQLPNDMFCATPKKATQIKFFGKINFFHTGHFFGFHPEDYESFKVMVADPEKSIIDSFSIVPVSVFEEAFDSIDRGKMIGYLKKIKKSSMTKRVGYLMERAGFDVYEELKGIINYKYIGLDPIAELKGEKNSKWRLIINI